MKYTVILVGSVPLEIRPELAERLVARFGLSTDQAEKLAARKAGRLLKPTTRTRAETLLSVYLAMNLKVTLEEVPEETTEEESEEESNQATTSSSLTAQLLNPTLDQTSNVYEEEDRRELPTETSTTTQLAPVMRRFGVRQQVLLITLAPLVLTGLFSTIGTTISNQRVLTQITRTGAESLATSIGTTVSIQNLSQLDSQLRVLLQQPNVGFIAVTTPNGQQYFRTKSTDVDTEFSNEVKAWITNHPGASTYRGRPNKNQAPNNYEVQNLGIYTQGNRRFTGPSQGLGAQDPLFTVAVGIITNESAALSRLSLILQLLLTAFFTGIAAFFAFRIARNIVKPLEDLVIVADKISLGELDTPVTMKRNDEIGDLARALERMRLSLEAAMDRLRRRRNRS